MPSTRTRKARRTAYRGVSPKAASLYREAKNCSDQRQRLNIARELHEELGLPTCEYNPLWPGQPFSLIAPPVDFDHERSAEQARQIAGELEQAIKTKTRKEKNNGQNDT